MQICFDGIFSKEEEVFISLRNRSFLYGDGLFESIKIINSRLVFYNDHLQRLQSGMNALGLKFEIPAAAFVNSLEELIRINELVNGKVRIQVFRRDGGMYGPFNDYASFIAIPYNTGRGYFKREIPKLGLYKEILKPINSLSGFKTNNALLNVLASRYARERGYDDVIIFNQYNQVCETSNSNIFFKVGDVFYTPPLSSGCVAGVLRGKLLEILQENNYLVSEMDCSEEIFLNAEMVLITNAINGITQVHSINNLNYLFKPMEFLVDALNEKSSV